MAVLDTRNVAPQKAGALFDVSLREFLFFAHGAKTVAYNHVAIITGGYDDTQAESEVLHRNL